MSKRAGEFITLREVVNEVGSDAVRFMMLFRKNDATLDFDLAKVVEQSRENPVFYVQYAHARGCSALRQSLSALHDVSSEQDLSKIDLTLLSDDAEMMILRRLAQFPRLIEASALAHEPHRVAFYLYDLASDFHALWNKGKDDPKLRFVLEDNPAITAARRVLVQAIVGVLKNGLSLLGVSAPDEMR